MTWWERASCRGMDTRIFYATEDGGHDLYAAARKVCVWCPVRRECLEEAMRAEGEARWTRHGMWGGKTPAERDGIRRRRAS